MLIEGGEELIGCDHDCREGIRGMCSAMINRVPHGPDGGTTTSQGHMRPFQGGGTTVVGPWRATALPVIRDLVVDRRAFDRIVQGGRVRLGEHRQGAGRETHAHAEGTSGHRLRRRDLHSLRRLRRRSQGRLRGAVHVRETCPSAPPAPRTAGAFHPGASDGRPDGRGRVGELHEHIGPRSRAPQGESASTSSAR